MTEGNYAEVASNGQEKKVAKEELHSSLVTYSSPTLQHLHRYPVVDKLIKRAVSVPVVSKAIAVSLLAVTGLKHKVWDSGKFPAVAKPVVSSSFKLLHKFDELVNLLVFSEGIDALFYAAKEHKNRPGVWLVWFLLDYFANVFNIILKEFVLKPFKLGNVAIKDASDATHKVTDVKELPHVSELSDTTKSLSQDLQSKVSESYIQPTKESAMQKYDTYIKPTAEKLHNVYAGNAKEKIDTYVKPKYDSYVKPGYDTAKETYKTITATYEQKLNKTESIPRAIVDTGYEVGVTTIGKLRGSTPPKEQQRPQTTEVSS